MAVTRPLLLERSVPGPVTTLASVSSFLRYREVRTFLHVRGPLRVGLHIQRVPSFFVFARVWKWSLGRPAITEEVVFTAEAVFLPGSSLVGRLYLCLFQGYTRNNFRHALV